MNDTVYVPSSDDEIAIVSEKTFKSSRRVKKISYVESPITPDERESVKRQQDFQQSPQLAKRKKITTARNTSVKKINYLRGPPLGSPILTKPSRSRGFKSRSSNPVATEQPEDNKRVEGYGRKLNNSSPIYSQTLFDNLDIVVDTEPSENLDLVVDTKINLSNNSKSNNYSFKSSLFTSKITDNDVKPLVHDSKSTVHTSESKYHDSKSSVHDSKSSVHDSKASVHTSKSSVPDSKSSVHTSKSSVHTSKSSVHTSKSSVHTSKSSVHTSKSSVHASKSSVHASESKVQDSRQRDNSYKTNPDCKFSATLPTVVELESPQKVESAIDYIPIAGKKSIKSRLSNLKKSKHQNDISMNSRLSLSMNDTGSSFGDSFMSEPLETSPKLKKGRKSLVKKKKVGNTKPKSIATKEKKTSKLLKTVKQVDSEVDFLFEWDTAKVISSRQAVSEWQARQVINLLDQECTLPFIARYRKANVGNLEIEKLREVHNAYQQLKEVKTKVSKLIQDNSKNISPDTKKFLLNSTSVKEVKSLCTSLNSKGERTLAERARKLGLEEAALFLLNDRNCESHEQMLWDLICPDVEGKSTLDQVRTGVKNIIADIISKDLEMLTGLKNSLKGRRDVMLTTSQSRKAAKSVTDAKKPRKVLAKRKSMGGNVPAKKKAPELSESVIQKFQLYFEFRNSVWNIKPHVVCAINRGEQLGVLSVKLQIPSAEYSNFVQFCSNKWLGSNIPQRNGSYVTHFRRSLMLEVFPDVWERLISPSIHTWIRGELSDMAELASIEIFNANLRRLLLTPPVRADSVLAIDPGFTHGCKLALIERKGKVLVVDTINPGRNELAAINTLEKILREYACKVIAIGNGTACRETEKWLGDLLKMKMFCDLDIQYTVIDESGASQYSVTDEARAEFPEMDVNHISAVSLARRLQDPLLEYVKVPPMHLGVGMYQHDVSSKLLSASLDSVMMECVSFVGVDLNVASEQVLRKVSGLNKSRAANIVKHREECGPFRNREELKKVKGIGPISYQQCSGFVRILPQTVRKSGLNPNLSVLCPLDSTTVHPESYHIATNLILQSGLSLNDIGTDKFIHDLKRFIERETLEKTAKQCDTDIENFKSILESLYQPSTFDYRAQFDKPLFRKEMTSMQDLKVGDVVTGSVRNVTSFGAFVDIGVGTAGLIHVSKMNGFKPQLGHNVQAIIERLDIQNKRIGLILKEIIG